MPDRTDTTTIGRLYVELVETRDQLVAARGMLEDLCAEYGEYDPDSDTIRWYASDGDLVCWMFADGSGEVSR